MKLVDQDSARGLTNAVDIFEQLPDKNIAQKTVTETSHFAEQLKNSEATFFQSDQGQMSGNP